MQRSRTGGDSSTFSAQLAEQVRDLVSFGLSSRATAGFWPLALVAELAQGFLITVSEYAWIEPGGCFCFTIARLGTASSAAASPL
jgi:hypothetical protein